MLDFDVADVKKIRVIIDSDTACEADDPFAIVHALLSPKLIVKAIVAEHFKQPGSMEQSRQAALRVTAALRSDVPVLLEELGNRQKACSLSFRKPVRKILIRCFCCVWGL